MRHKPLMFSSGKEDICILADLGSCWSLCGQARGSGLMAGVLIETMVVMSIILIAGLASSTWLATWPEIICDSSKEEKWKNLALLVQQSHHSVVETRWTLIYFTTFNTPVSLFMHAGVCGRMQTWFYSLFLYCSSLLLCLLAGKRGEAEWGSQTKCCVFIHSNTASREQVKQQMVWLYVPYLTVTVFSTPWVGQRFQTRSLSWRS